MENKDAVWKFYVDNLYRNYISFNEVKTENIKFVKVFFASAVDSHPTPKIYAENAINESILVRNNQDNDFNNYNLTNINSVTLNTQAVNDNQVITKAYVDQFHQDDEQSRRDLGLNFYDESGDLEENNKDKDVNGNTLINLDSVSVNSNPSPDNKLTSKNNVDG